jgi:putative permease
MNKKGKFKFTAISLRIILYKQYLMNVIKPANSPFYFKLAMVLVSLICLGYLSVIGKQILSPLLFSLLFAILLLPISVFFEKRCKFPRSAASGLSVILFLLAIAGLLYIVGSQLTNLASDWPMFKVQATTSFNNLQEWIYTTFHVNFKKQMAYIDSSASKLMNVSTSVVGTTVITVSSVMLFLVFTMIYTFFLLFYRRLILKFLIGVFKEENSATLYEVVAQIQSIIRKYILGLLLEMGIVAGACCIAFWLLGIKYALLLGLITGLFNIIPYIGIFSALLLSTLITFATGAAAGKILIVVITVVAMHLVDSNVLLPLVVGSKVRINALITLMGVIIGEMMWGIPGMFLAIPVIAMTKTVFDRVEGLQPWGILLGAEKESVDISDTSKTVQTQTIDTIDTSEHIINTKGNTSGNIETVGK